MARLQRETRQLHDLVMEKELEIAKMRLNENKLKEATKELAAKRAMLMKSCYDTDSRCKQLDLQIRSFNTSGGNFSSELNKGGRSEI